MNTRGGGALEVGDHRLLEHGSERKGALVSDVVDSETASEGWDGDGERLGVSMGVDKGRTLGGGGALERGHGALLEPLAQLGDALSGVLALTIIVEAAEMVIVQTAKVRSCSVNGR